MRLCRRLEPTSGACRFGSVPCLVCDGVFHGRHDADHPGGDAQFKIIHVVLLLFLGIIEYMIL